MTHQEALVPGANCVTIAQFQQDLEQAIAQVGYPHIVALIVVSLRRSDRIASMLDTPGSRTVTAQVLARLGGMLRETDRLVLASPDEVWLLLPRLPAAAMVTLAVNRLLSVLGPALVHEGHAVFVRPSIGVACAPHNATSAALLLRAADLAQQTARSANVVWLMSEVSGAGSGRVPDDLEGAVKQVLTENSLTVVYQPKVDLLTRRVKSVEALVRWPAGDGHLVPTVLLVETAERAGMIGALTMHVLNNALRERSAWLQEGLDIQVWINLSAHSLAIQELPQLLLQTLDVWHTPPAAIGLEITESGLIRDIDSTTAILFALQQAGFQMAIDDFGTGYSSLAYLRRFPITELKIDRMFVHGMVDSQPDHQIVQSIIDLAHNFGLKVVAEGAEDEQTVAELQKLKCDMVQGYVYAKPMPAAALVDWVRAFHAGASLQEN